MRMVQRRDRARFLLEPLAVLAREILIATMRSSRVSRAFQTSPIRRRQSRQDLVWTEPDSRFRVARGVSGLCIYASFTPLTACGGQFAR